MSHHRIIYIVCIILSPVYIQCPAAQLVHPSQRPSRLRLWHDQLFAKPPHHGGVVAWWAVGSLTAWPYVVIVLLYVAIDNRFC